MRDADIYFLKHPPPLAGASYRRDSRASASGRGELQARLTSLKCGEEKVAEWVRSTRAGYGLDLAHPSTWAVVAADEETSSYHQIMRHVLETLGLEDLPPIVPAPLK